MLEVVAGHATLAGMATTALTTLYLAESFIGQIHQIGLYLRQEGFRQAL